MKRFFKFILFTLIFICSTSFAAQKITIFVDNTPISSDVEPFIKSGTTYVPIRFIANALNVDSITWNENTKSVAIKDNSTSILLLVNKNYAYVNNQYTPLTNNALLVNNRTFVPLRFISEILGAEVSWDQNNYTVAISTKLDSASIVASSTTPTIELPGKSTYTSEINTSTTVSKNTSSSKIVTETPVLANISDTSNSIEGPVSIDISDTANSVETTELVEEEIINEKDLTDNDDAVYWLSKIIEAEASGEPYIGKVAIGEVILNRVKSEDFPNTIWGVIFDDNFGIQFEPVENGTIYNSPSEDSIKAAKEALSGSNYVGNCLYFFNPKIAKSSWITNNRQYYKTISNHDFYI